MDSPQKLPPQHPLGHWPPPEASIQSEHLGTGQDELQAKGQEVELEEAVGGERCSWAVIVLSDPHQESRASLASR